MNSLIASVKPAAQQFGDVSLSAVSLGVVGVSRSHEGLRDDIPGAPFDDKACIRKLIYQCKLVYVCKWLLLYSFSACSALAWALLE